MALDIRNTEGMLLKLGDEDEVFLSSKFRRALEHVRAFHGSPDLPQVFERLGFLAVHVPGKSNIYVTLLSALHGTFPHEVEALMAGWAHTLRTAIDTHDENQAVNITLMLSEAVRIGFVNSLTFLSVLMDLVSLAEADVARLKTVARLLLVALPGVFQIFLEKYELEYKNLLDDLGKLLDTRDPPEDMLDEKAAFEALKGLQTPADAKDLFAPLRLQVQEEDGPVRTVRKTFKLLQEGSHAKPAEGVRKESVAPRRWVRRRVLTCHGGNSPLNIVAMSTYLHQLAVAFHKNPSLFWERVSTAAWGAFADLRDWLLMEVFLDLICTDDLVHFRRNFLFVCRAVSVSIETQKRTVFYEQAFEELSAALARHSDAAELHHVARVIKLVAFVNFQAKTALALASDPFAPHQDLYYFVNMLFAIQSRQLALKAGLADDFQAPE